jgi:hypothetical protein
MLAFVEFILLEKCQKHFLSVTTPVYTPAQNVCTTGAIPELGQTVQPHLPFSPYLLPSALHLFGALKDSCRGKRATVSGQKCFVHVLGCEWNTAVDKGGEQLFGEMLRRFIYLTCIQCEIKKYKALFLRVTQKCIYCFNKFAYCVTSYTDKKCDVYSKLG